MVIVQYGMGKSGSSFVFQMLSKLLQSRFSDWDNYMEHRRSLVDEIYHNDYVEISNNQLKNLIEQVPKFEYYTLKTHDCPDINRLGQKIEYIQEALNNNELRVIATFRDPRDMCLSYLDHSKAHKEGKKDFFSNEIKSPKDAIINVKREYEILEHWMQYDNILWIPFEKLTSQPQTILELIRAEIGLYYINLKFYLNELLENKSKIHQFNKGIFERWKKDLSDEELISLNVSLKNELNIYYRLKQDIESVETAE